METFEPMAGTNISSAIEEALSLATRDEPCTFDFNGTTVIVNAGDDPAALEKKWYADFDANQKAYLASPEYAEAQARRKAEAEQERRNFATQVESLKTLNEKELRELKLIWPHTSDELNSLIIALTERQHDYGTCVYAMSIAATAAFHFVSHVLGVTGFQASCADMDVLRRTRLYDGPFAIIKAEDMLYPQYDIPAKVSEIVSEWKPWAAEQARIKLQENGHAHPDVRARWEALAAFNAPTAEGAQPNR
jgi:hypothetical protein